MSTDNTQEPTEELTVRVTIARRSDRSDEYRHQFNGVDVPSAVTEAFQEFLTRHIGFDPRQEAGADVVASLDELPADDRPKNRP